MFKDFRGVSRIGVLAVVTAGTGWLFDSYVINAFTYNLAAIQKTFSLSLAAIGIITSIYLIGYTLGTVAGGTIADYFGRKRALIFSITWYVIAAVLSGLAISPWMFASFRLLTGVGAGGELPVSSTFITDTWPAKVRNRGTGLMNLGYPLGYLLMIAVSLAVVPFWGWRAVFVLAVIPAVLIVIIRLKVSESPAFVRVNEELKKNVGRPRKFTFAQVLHSRYRRQFVGQLLIWIGNGFTFWSFVTFIPLYLITVAKVPKSELAVFLIVFNLFYAVMPYLATWVSDLIGRRWAGSIAALLSMIGVWLFTLGPTTRPWLFVVGGLTYGLYAAPWTIGFTFSTEAFPAEIRGSAISLVMTIGRVVSIIAPLVVGGLAATIGFGAMMRLSGLMWIVAIVGFLVSKETLNVPLTDIVETGEVVGTGADPVVG